MDKSDRLKRAREAAGFETASDAARALGVPGPTYIGHENGARGFTTSSAERYARKFKVSLDWLLTGRDDGQQPPDAQPVFATIPIVGIVAAGLWQEMEDSLHEPMGHIPLMPGLKHPRECYYVLKANGTSMNLVFPDGALLICLDVARAGIPIVDGDIVIVENRREQAGLREISAKRVRVVRGVLQFRPESSDPKHSKPLSITSSGLDDSVHVLARVEGAYTQF